MMSSPAFQAAQSSATPREEIDVLLERVSAQKHAWLDVGIAERVELLNACLLSARNVAEGWVRAACRAKSIDFDSPLSGEEWLGGPMVTIRNIRLFRDALMHQGAPALRGVRVQKSASGASQRIAQVFPADAFDRLLYMGFSGDVWLQPGKPASQGAIYRSKPSHGKLALVLGAGNVASIGPMDALHKLFVEDEVVILKTNPVNEYLKPFWDEALRPLVERGFLAVVRGGADVGAYLTDHPSVDTIHITGSDRTHDAIVWGATADEQAKNKQNDTPRLQKPISSELGCVTPILIVPGNWSERDLKRQAWHVASMVTNNASFNCNAAKILVTSKNWAQRGRFIELLEAKLKECVPRKAYYPGAEQRYDAFLARYPKARPASERKAGVVPFTLLPEVPATPNEYALTNEAFCGVLADVALDTANAADFLSRAVEFANEICWGTLSCGIFIDPATERANREAFDQAIANLRYGGIGINCWPAVIYGLVSTTWGAYPGHPLNDIRSGRGVVHNSFMLDYPQKSVLRVPFKPFPRPVWFAGHPKVHKLGPLLCDFEAAPSLLKLPALFAKAL